MKFTTNRGGPLIGPSATATEDRRSYQIDDRIMVTYDFDQLEYRVNEGTDMLGWEAQGWLGRDYNKLWVKTEGDQRLSGDNGGEAEVQLLYGQSIAPFWNFQVGGRHDQLHGAGPDPSRFSP